MTDMESADGVAYLQRRLAKTGVEKALVEAGAVDGDEVTIGPMTFDLDLSSAREHDVDTGKAEEPPA